MKWERLDCLEPYDLFSYFDYIREEAECQGFKEEAEATNFVEELFSKDFKVLWNKIRYDDIEVQYDEHELCDGEDKPTYGVYIYVNENFINVLEDMLPEYFI